MDTVIRVQILDVVVCISHSANKLRKGMNPTVLHPAMGKLLGRLGSVTLLWQLVLEKKNSKFKLVKIH